MTEGRLAQEAVAQWPAVPAEGAVGFGDQQSGIDFQLLLHGEELHAIDVLLDVQLQRERSVTEDVAGPQRDVVAADRQQQDVVDGCWQRRFLRAGVCDPNSERVGHQRVGEL